MSRIIRFLYIAFVKKEIYKDDSLNHFSAKSISRQDYYSARSFIDKYKSSKNNLIRWI